MKLFIVLALAAVALAAPQQQRTERQAGGEPQIVLYDSNNDGSGNYFYVYEQSDGRRQEETGEVRNPGAENQIIAVKGSYAWVGPDGVTYLVNYIADDNGFQPSIEQGPGGAVPAAILASLAG